MKKELRQAKIEQLITKQIISNQDDLLKALKKAGISATQATISRDIREMQIVKQQDGDGHLRYVVFKEQNQAEWLRLYKAIYDFVIEITQVEFVNVVKTMPRNANVLAAIIDDLKPECVAGTIAGYDTLVVISPSVDAALEFKKMTIEHINHDAIGTAPEDD